jgi:hypothetical protein
MRCVTVLARSSLVFALLGLVVRADDPPKKSEKSSQDAPSAMAAPTQEHKLLAKDIGVWDAMIKTYIGGPGSEPSLSKGVETSTLMTGGLWLISTFKGEFAGQTFEGTGVTGFDPKKKKYVGTWADNMTPELTLLEGTYDEKAKTMTMTGTGSGEDGKPMSLQYITEHKDENTRVFTISMKGEQTDGKWMKMMQIDYKRRAK